MRPLSAFAMFLALAAPFVPTPAQTPEPMLGHGIELPVGATPAGMRPVATLRPSSRVRFDRGGMRGGGSGIRVTTVADGAFGMFAPAPAPVSRLGPATETAAPGRR